MTTRNSDGLLESQPRSSQNSLAGRRASRSNATLGSRALQRPWQQAGGCEALPSASGPKIFASHHISTVGYAADSHTPGHRSTSSPAALRRLSKPTASPLRIAAGRLPAAASTRSHPGHLRYLLQRLRERREMQRLRARQPFPTTCWASRRRDLPTPRAIQIPKSRPLPRGSSAWPRPAELPPAP